MALISVATLHLRAIEPFIEKYQLMGHSIEVQHDGCDNDIDVMAERIAGLVQWAISGAALQSLLRSERQPVAVPPCSAGLEARIRVSKFSYWRSRYSFGGPP